MDSTIRIDPKKEPSQTTDSNGRLEYPYMLTINGTTVSIRFTGTESLSRRLAEAFRAVVN